MTHVTCRLTAKNRDQLRNPTLGSRVWATFPFFIFIRHFTRVFTGWVMKCWCGCLSAARCRLFAYGPADATASQTPIISCLIIKSRLVLPFWYQITQVVLEKRPLNGCSSSSSRSLRYDTRCNFNVRSKADISQLNLPTLGSA